MEEKDQWYTNKQLFEQILAMKGDFQRLSQEMKETREVIKKYNGLREEIHQLRTEVNEMKAVNSGKSTVLKTIREWGGWIVAILTLLFNIYKNSGQ